VFRYQAGVVSCSQRGVLFPQARRPLGFAARARGLLGTREMATEAGLWFDRCSAVHMFGMRYPLDLLFLRGGQIIKLCRDVRPQRFRACRGADCTLEVACGAIERHCLAVGDRLEFWSLQ
jgi:hypothetical protein